MKKKNLTSMSLNKKSISQLNIQDQLKGGTLASVHIKCNIAQSSRVGYNCAFLCFSTIPNGGCEE